MIAVGVMIDGFTLPQIRQIIQSINANESVGAAVGTYSGETQAVATTESTIAVAKTGPVTGIYDPELAALLAGDL